MLITRAVTVRGVPFLRLPDTMALLHLYVVRREPVRQQRLAQRGAMDRHPDSVGERVAGHQVRLLLDVSDFPFSSMPIRTVS
jgi:hypothetical protein